MAVFMFRQIPSILIPRRRRLPMRSVSIQGLSTTLYVLTLFPGIIHFFRVLDPEFPSSRVCIKIPSTWEGMQACKVLEASGLKTLATTLFCMEQGVLAAEAGCTYIAPYVYVYGQLLLAFKRLMWRGAKTPLILCIWNNNQTPWSS